MPLLLEQRARGLRRPHGAEVVAPAFYEHGLELHAHVFLQERNVLGDQLFLQGNGVRGNHGVDIFPHGGQDQRHEVGEALADAGPGFDDQVVLVHDRFRDRIGHGPLLRAWFVRKRFVPAGDFEPPAGAEKIVRFPSQGGDISLCRLFFFRRNHSGSRSRKGYHRKKLLKKPQRSAYCTRFFGASVAQW